MITPRSHGSTMAKQAILDTALLGSLIGTARAPSGGRMEGLGRGAVIGAGTGAGMIGGGALGGLAGLGLGGLAHAGGVGSPELMRALAGGGTIAGAGLGGYGGFKGTQHLMGKPSWESKGEPKPEAAPAETASEDAKQKEDDEVQKPKADKAASAELPLSKQAAAVQVTLADLMPKLAKAQKTVDNGEQKQLDREWLKTFAA